MAHGGLHPDVLLSIELGATMTRNQYAADPAPVIAELYAIAGDRLDILAAEVGSWVGYYEDDYTRTLTTALRALPLDMGDAISAGQARRAAPHHSTPGAPTRAAR